MRSEYLLMFEEHEQNRAWFEKNYQELLTMFDGEYVAIYKREAVDHDKDLDELMKRVEAKYPIENVLVEYVTREKLELVL